MAKPFKVTLIRPGALGDVIAARAVIAYLRACHNDVEIALIAPGRRGAFLARPGWADTWLDWESVDVAWLFGPAESDPPDALAKAIAADTDLVVSYLDPRDSGSGGDCKHAVAMLSPKADHLVWPSRPAPTDSPLQIGRWLIEPVRRMYPSDYQTVQSALDRKITVAADTDPDADSAALFDQAGAISGSYAVIHPGSGSRTKNWPVENYAAVAAKLQSGRLCSGPMRIVVTAGEADGEIADQLIRSVPGAIIVSNPSIERLALILAGAALYLGNDSGVSHLASAVKSRRGHRPHALVLFGHTYPRIWAPPGATIIHEEQGMAALREERVWERIESIMENGNPNKT